MRQSNCSKTYLSFLWNIYSFELSLNLYNFFYHSILSDLLKSIQPFLILCFTIYIYIYSILCFLVNNAKYLHPSVRSFTDKRKALEARNNRSLTFSLTFYSLDPLRLPLLSLTIFQQPAARNYRHTFSNGQIAAN